MTETIQQPSTDFIMNQEELNFNGKRENENITNFADNDTEMTTEMSSSIQKELKMLAKKSKFKKMKVLQKKVARIPVWSESVQPIQVLNELVHGLGYTFDVETKVDHKVKYICKCNVKLELDAPDSPEIEIIGDGLSKKEAQRKCSFLALCHLYPNSFTPTQEVIMSYNIDYAIDKTKVDNKKPKSEAAAGAENVNPEAKILEDIKKRIKKLITKESLLTKTATQLLHELHTPLADTAECVNEKGASEHQKFTYQYKNTLIKNEGIGYSDSHLLLAYGFGKSKQIAKQQAAKNAFKQFFACDLDQIIMTPDLFPKM
jgi:dsRNA-specific ribonuclease